MNQTLRLVPLKEIPEDGTLRQQWNALVQRVDRPQVFYTYEWSLAVQRAYRAVSHPRLFLAYDEEESLCGIASLALDTDGKCASFLCATTGDYCDFLSKPEHKPAFVAAVLSELRKHGIGEVTLTNLPADSDTVAALQPASKQNGYRCFMRTAYVCAQVALSKLERRPGENKPVLPGKKMVRRSLSAMGREGPVRLDHARTWDAVGPFLPQFAQAHVARFLATGRISNLARPERRRFLDELAKLLSKPGWLVLTRMMSGGSTLAWNYGFQYEGAWFWYQPTFDSDLEKLSPGFCLLAKLIEEAADNPALTSVDLGLGAEEYKERFANQTRETLYVTLRTSAAQYVRDIARYRATQTIMASPRLEVAVRAAAVRLRRLREGARRDGVAGTLRLLAKRAGALLWSETEVSFFEWSRGAAVAEPVAAKLEAVDLNHLASSATRYVDDEASLAYLLRSASRMRERNAEGFGSTDTDGSLLGCAWVTAFDGFFLPELNAKVDPVSMDDVMLFDCWCSPDAADHGCYAQTIRLIAERMKEQGKKPWTYSEASDVLSVRSLESAGFQLRYSLVGRRILGWQTIKRKNPTSNKALASEVSARV